MTIINSRIGSRTNLNYHIQPVNNFTIRIPFYIYTNDEKKLDTYSFIEKRVNTLISFLSNLDWSNCANLQELWIIHSLNQLGINISKSFILSTFTDERVGFNDLDRKPISINFPETFDPEIKRVRYSDGSTILYLSSQYLSDFGIYANLTVPFSEMGMSFNALHLYEHIMTCGWKKTDYSKMKFMNGSTWPNGLCSVFAICNTLDSMKEFAACYIKFFLDSRDADFWKQAENIESLKLETQRTISETRAERTLSSLCRSDYHAYDYNYNTNIFTYWSNKPFDLLIAGNAPISKLQLNATTINQYIAKHPIRRVMKPNNIIYHSLPLDTIKMKCLHGFRVVSSETNEIKDALLQSSPLNKSLYGLDNKIISDNEDLNSYNILLHVLLYDNKMFSDAEVEAFVKRSVIPFSCVFFGECALCSKFAGDYLFDPDEDDPKLFEPYCDERLIKQIPDKAEIKKKTNQSTENTSQTEEDLLSSSEAYSESEEQ